MTTIKARTMKSFLKLVGCLIILVMVTPKGNAEDKSQAEVKGYYLPNNAPFGDAKFEAKANKMLWWIIKNTEYEYKNLPPVIFVNGDTMNYLYTFPNGYAEAGVIGAYLYDSKIMFLSLNFKWGQDDFILLHELVHHLQAENEAEWECLGQAEEEAYKLQAQWVRETGVGQMPDIMTLLTVGNCAFGSGQ